MTPRIVDQAGIVEGAIFAEISPEVLDVRILLHPPLAEVESVRRCTLTPGASSILLTVEWCVHEDAYGCVDVEIQGVPESWSVVGMTADQCLRDEGAWATELSFMLVGGGRRHWVQAEVAR